MRCPSQCLWHRCSDFMCRWRHRRTFWYTWLLLRHRRTRAETRETPNRRVNDGCQLIQSMNSISLIMLVRYCFYAATCTTVVSTFLSRVTMLYMRNAILFYQFPPSLSVCLSDGSIVSKQMEISSRHTFWQSVTASDFLFESHHLYKIPVRTPIAGR